MNDRVFEPNKLKISKLNVFLLNFKKPYIGHDKEGRIETYTYMKKLFGKIYVTKTEQYVDGKLFMKNELSFKDCE